MASFLLNSLPATTTTTRGAPRFAAKSGGSRRRRVVSRSSSSSQNSSSKSSTFFTEHINDDFDGSSTTITSRDDERRQQQQQQRRQFLPPKEVLQSIYVPESLAEIRAYVRWEEFGKPEETTAEWQASEYKNAVLDLKLDLLSGMTLNDIRRRYGVEPVDGDDDELPMFTMDEELEKRMKLAEAMTRVEKVGKMSLVEEDSASPVRYGDAMVDSSSSSVVDEFIKPLPTSPLSSSVIDHVVSAEEMTEEEREMMEEEATVVDRAALSIEYEAEDEEEEERAVLTEAEEDFLQELQASTTFDADDFLPMTEEKKKKSEEEEKNLGVLAEDEEEKVEEEKKRQKAIASELVLNLKVEVDKYKQSAESLKTQMLEATEKAEKASSEFDSMKEQRNRLARELSELELETAAKDDEIKELNEFLVSSEKDFKQSKMEELQSLRESLEQMKEEKKAAEVLARAYKQDFVQERELNAKFREEKNQMMEEKTKSERELRAAANESEMKLSAAMRENAELKKIWDSDRKVIEILTKKLDEMSEKPGLGAAIVNTYSTVKTVIPKYSSVIASTTMNTTKGVVSKTTDISGKFFSAVKTKLEKIKEDELALMDEEEDDDEFEDSDVRTGIFL
ncbi:predicted protein [Bathycoccus prasinos]|uniref:DUF7067 domain-containing protein n=1 Tax=Bathycoccus prasinos TaxID=41875 RepID=K8EN32_9CHLO|nr:predicted protein [Bathycoccus prasinos]CCO19436.1 predicted protein [Bathycoccus prasinos]|eukprot:XP_007509633.1 predicted protein [Bathycoccus prasinos]